MPKAVLFLHGEMVRQKGIPAPKRATMQNWRKHLIKSFASELTAVGVEMLLSAAPIREMVSENEIRISLPGDVAFLVDRMTDALA